jgi:DNA polymerase
MTDHDRTPPTEEQKSKLRALGFPETHMSAVRSAKNAAAILHNIHTPEEMRRFIGSGGTPAPDESTSREAGTPQTASPPTSEAHKEPSSRANRAPAPADAPQPTPTENTVPGTLWDESSTPEVADAPPTSETDEEPPPESNRDDIARLTPEEAPDQHDFWADIETLGRSNLRIVGSENYLHHKHTRPLVLIWALDDGPVRVWKWGEPIEPLLVAMSTEPRFISHGTFDRICWNAHLAPLGPPPIPIERSEDNMVRCRKAGIPSGLDAAAKALKFPPELQKLDGRIALEMSRPREPRPDEDPDGLYALDDPEKEARLIKYGIRDLEVLRALNKALPPLTEDERLEWIYSEHTNEIGIYLDGLAIEKACELIDIAQAEANAKLQRLTNNEIATIGQRDKILTWLNARGAGLEDLQAETLEEFLKRPDLSEEVRGVAEARYEAADAAPLKARSMRARRGEDGRAYHVFDFWRAVTGRWSSSSVQVHNVKKSEGEDIAEKFAAVLSGDPERVRQFGPIMRVIGDALRAVICARPDCRFLGMDLSGIESCTLAGIAGERWKIEQWKKFFRTRDPAEDPYFIIGKWLGFPDDVARRYGKIADLAFGFGGSIGAWRRFAPPGDTTSDEQIKRYRDIWRQRHPAIVHFWRGLNATVLKTVQSEATTSFGRLTIHCQTVAGHNWLYIRLPSGRSIPYPFAELKHYVDKDGKPTVGVGFMDYQSQKWRPYKSPTGAPIVWHGLLIENVTQGIARDLLAATLVRLWMKGYPPTLHVHDEIVVEVPVNSEHSLDKFKELCERRPEWAVEMDIPVSAKVWERQRWAEGVGIPVTHTPGAVITPDQLVKLHKDKVEKPKTPRTKPVRERPDKTKSGGTLGEPLEQLVANNPPPETGIAPDLQSPKSNDGGLDDIPDFTVPPEPDDAPRFVKGNGRPPEPPPALNKPSVSPLMTDPTETTHFLTLLDRATTQFTFQTFDDNIERKSKALARVLHGTLNEHFAELTRLNNLGAGIFVTICETNLRGRLITDILRVRLLFVDCDGVPLPRDGPQLYVAVQSSPDRFHGYWKPNGVALDAFTPTQELIAKRFGGDPTVKDLSRVMRLPGFWHRKGEPFMVRIIEVHEDAPACSAADFETDKIKYQAKARQDDANFEGLDGPWAILNTLALANLNKWVPQLFGDAAVYQPGTGAYRISSKTLGRGLEEDLSIHPKGIKDWGVDDLGGAHQGGRTPIDLVSEYRRVDASTAFEWLDACLRDVEKTKDEPWPPRRAPIHEWAGKPAPQPEYTVENRILAEQVFSFAGEGGTGKSGMVEQLCAAHVIEREWFGCMPKQGPAIYIECEDTLKMLWWRLARIAEYYNVLIETFAKDLHLYSLTENNSILAATNKRGIVEPTRLFHWLYEIAGDIKPVQIGIASVANVFAGSEINRTEVQQFIKLMNRIPQVTKGSLTLVSQPSLTGLASNDISHQGLSGTTQWHNAVRSRAVVTHIKPKNGESVVDTGLRLITFLKNQYGPPAANILVRWESGMFVPATGTPRDASERANAAESLTIALLKRFTAQNRNMSISVNPHNYAPKVFAETAEAEAAGITIKDFKMAIERLLLREVIINKDFHPTRKTKGTAHYRLIVKEDLKEDAT